MEGQDQVGGELETAEPNLVAEGNSGIVQPSGTETGKTGEVAEEPVKKEITQETIDRAVSKKHIELLKTQTELETGRGRIAELEAKLNVTPDKPVIPPLPDQFDDDFQAKMADRDEKIQKLGEFNRDEALRDQDTRSTQAQQILDQQAQQQQTVKAYQEKATTLGLDHKELEDAENIVGAYIRAPEVAQYLLSDANGPLVVSHLAKHPAELEKISQMAPMKAAIYLSTSIMPEAIKAKPGTTQTPDPAQTLNGGGAPKEESPWISGVTFDYGDD